MDFPIYLAMTAAELARCEAVPPRIGWMACHFSAYGTGLSNCPDTLPKGSLLILNDRTPIHGHEPARVAEQLQLLAERTDAAGLLIDFQRPVTQEALAVILALQELPCPVAVTEDYAKEFHCGVFLTPAPLHKPLQTHLAPWIGRDIWLELALEQQTLTLTQEGCRILPCGADILPETGFEDNALHCHYLAELADDQAAFTLYRTREDLYGLLEEAQALGVSRAVGLYQQLQGLFYLST